MCISVGMNGCWRKQFERRWDGNISVLLDQISTVCCMQLKKLVVSCTRVLCQFISSGVYTNTTQVFKEEKFREGGVSFSAPVSL